MNININKTSLFGVAKKRSWKNRLKTILKKWQRFPLWHRHRRLLWPY